MTKNQTTSTKASTTRACRCGCGESTSSSKTQYRPGHDARHVGIVARDIAASSQEGYERTTADSDLGSVLLQGKAQAMADRLLAKKQPQDRKVAKKEAKLAAADKVAQEEAEYAEKTAPPEPMFEDEIASGYKTTEGVKVGRWVYPGRQNHFGVQERNTKRDGSGEWVAV